jgi:membrane protease YdiL (CAAX protease family)
MNSPVPPPSLSPEEKTPDSSVPVAAPPPNPSKTLPEKIFLGPGGLRLGWRILLYLGVAAAVAYGLLWLGGSFFPDIASGVARLWQEMYGEAALLIAALAPAFLMARIEERSFDDYGLPRRLAFGKLFWTGALWGIVSIGLLLLLLRGVHVFYFGHLALHGLRIWRFALFWGAYFLIVGLFEEFLLRGYLLFTVAQRLGFWPAAGMLSFAFGAIHLMNSGEGAVGALSAAFIGLFFCLTLQRTGTLWFAVGFHAAWDWGQTYVCGVADSGTIEPGHLLTPSFHGPAWLTGGSVGPEGSAVCFLLVVALWAVFARRYPQAKYQN